MLCGSAREIPKLESWPRDIAWDSTLYLVQCKELFPHDQAGTDFPHGTVAKTLEVCPTGLKKQLTTPTT